MTVYLYSTYIYLLIIHSKLLYMLHVGSPGGLSFSALNRIKNHLRSSIKEVRTFFINTYFISLIKMFTF